MFHFFLRYELMPEKYSLPSFMRMADYHRREVAFSVRYMQQAFQEKLIAFKSDFSGFDLSSLLVKRCDYIGCLV
jgi:hypothetical protein